MAKRENLSGKRFSYLVALEYAGRSKSKNTQWLCRCDCGNEKIVEARKLKDGQVKSCGCMHHKYGHQQSNTRLYHIWLTMKARCNNEKSHKYKDYGGRGITVCQEWQKDFMAFYDWSMANGYKEDLSIDRIDNNKGYSPENCRWATPKEQANNTRANKYITYNGETHTISEWCDIKKITRSALYHRLERGWSIQDALSTGV